MKITIREKKRNLIIYIALTLLTLAVFWQVYQYDFVNIDDYVYVTENKNIQSGITLKGILWAFSTTYAEFWHPLTWISLMLDYQRFGLNAGGYHMTNVILHILSTLLLFWLFNRMTGAVWKSAFVAAFFAIHPLHVESVAWIAERKDVQSGFFWMLTLCFYVFYTEKPTLKRYLFVLFSFTCALMSKPIAVILPVIMILLDYWPLNRFQLQKSKLYFWQLKEKFLFLCLSAAFSVVTLMAQPDQSAVKVYPLALRLANASIAFITYLEKTFFPDNMAVFYPFPSQIHLSYVLGTSFLITIITFIVILKSQRIAYAFVGWFWYLITLLPVIGIVKVGDFAMADRYSYLSGIGIAIMLAWGMPDLIKSENIRKKILFPAGLGFLAIMALLSSQQCSYWKNSVTLFNHATQSIKNNYFAYDGLGIALIEEGKFEEAIESFSKAILIAPDYLVPYINRGNAYEKIGHNQKAIDDYNQAITMKPNYSVAYYDRGIVYMKLRQYPIALEDFNKAIYYKTDNAKNYYTRGTAYEKLGQHQKALEDYTHAILLKKDYPDAYHNRGIIHGIMGKYQTAIDDFNKAIGLKENYIEAYNNRGFTYDKIGLYQRAIEDYDQAIRLKPNYAEAYANRAVAYLKQGRKESGCRDAEKACELGHCKTLESAKEIGLCR
ncbi:MAG: tetratricopeptide repeat protein [Smithella sp.]